MFLDKRFWTERKGSRGRGFVAAKWLVVFCAWLSLVTLQRGRAAAQEPPTGVGGKPSQRSARCWIRLRPAAKKSSLIFVPPDRISSDFWLPAYFYGDSDFWVKKM